ncbi:MAG TPA: ABC transporter substrate binding protein [Patescibacteria group bacterium]|nr:ABC transporter substrate binding protein [Patescibacteria group bacterium]
MKSIQRHFWAVLLFVCALTLPSSATATPGPDQQIAEKNILILHSYHKGLAWTDEQNEGMIQTFHQQNLEPLFHVEYMDWKYSPTEENLRQRYDQYRLRYAARKIDLILTTDDAALSFALKYRQELFSNAPIVFNGVLQHAARQMLRGQTNVTGVYERFDTAGTVQLMQNFNPSLRHVYLLYDNSESGLQTAQIMMDEARSVNSSLNFIHLNATTFQNILQLLTNPPDTDHSAVLVNTYSRDTEGISMEMERFVRRFSEVSKIPLYILYDFDSNHGAVGGSLAVSRQQGNMSAQLGIRILRGENAGDIPAAVDAGFTTIIDYNRLLRYRLPLDRIPAAAQVINRPLTFYERHQDAIRAAIAVFAVMSLIIFLLLVNLRHRTMTAKKLAAARTYLDKIINAVPDPIAVKDGKYRFVLVNQAMTDLVGRQRKDILHKTTAEVAYTSQTAVHDLHDKEVLTSGLEASYIWDTLDAQGHVRVLETRKTCYIDPQGHHFLVAASRDITELKQAEAALKQLNEELELKVQHRTRQWENANTELAALNQEMQSMNETLLEANLTLKEEVSERRRIEAELQQTVNTLRQTQEQLVRSGKLAALGLLVAGVAHEINTPLGNSVTAASLLRCSQENLAAYIDSPPVSRSTIKEHLADQLESLVLLESNLHRAVELVQSFKTVATDQLQEEKHLFLVRQCLNDTLLTLHSRLKKTHLQVIVHCPEDLEWNSYPGILSQIVSNLIINALTHAYDPLQEGRLLLEIFRDGTDMVCRYTDDGKGMSANVREKIFDPFFTTRRGSGSTGLGMYIVYNLVTQKLGGSIHCDSAPGDGTRFVIRVPFQSPD